MSEVIDGVSPITTQIVQASGHTLVFHGTSKICIEKSNNSSITTQVIENSQTYPILEKISKIDFREMI